MTVPSNLDEQIRKRAAELLGGESDRANVFADFDNDASKDALEKA